MIKIASYNLWNGASDTYFRLVDFIKEEKFDVLCLQETNGWQDNDLVRLKEFADRTGFTNYQYGNSNSEYKLATLTTLPVISQIVHQEGFWHCAVETHLRVDGTEIVVVNLDLDPWKEEPRLKEIERLLAKLDPAKPTIITGDFNSLSRQDNYPPEFLAKLQAEGMYKYGQNELEFRVTDRLAQAGFVDMAAWFNNLEKTTPTAYGAGESQAEAPARIDYMFASKAAVPLVQSYEVLKTETTDRISDHYPIILTLGEDQPEPEPAPAPEAPAEPQPATPTPAEPVPHNTATEGELKIEH